MKYEELSEDAKQVAREWFRSSSVSDNDMSESLNESFNYHLEEKGYPRNMSIAFSLGYSQGDGVAFYGELPDENVEKILERVMDANEFRKAKRVLKYIYVYIKRNSVS